MMELSDQLKSQRVKDDTKSFYNERINRKVHDLIADIMVIGDSDTKALLSALTLDQMIYWMVRFGIPKELIVKTIETSYRDYKI
jgi:hypothetical protein